jgi:hypothetical protein
VRASTRAVGQARKLGFDRPPSMAGESEYRWLLTVSGGDPWPDNDSCQVLEKREQRID